MRSCHPGSQMILWSCCLVRFSEKLKTYLHYHNAHGRQSWHDGDLIWRASTHKVTWLLIHMVSWVHVKNLKEYPIPQCLFPTDFAGCLYTMRSSNPWCHMSLELHVLIRWLGILSMFLYCYIYISFLYLLLSIPTMSVDIKYCKKVTFADRFLPSHITI